MKTLELKNWSVAYPGTPPVFSGLSTQFQVGKIYAVIGRNGVGKSTLLKSIAGISDSNILTGHALWNGNETLSLSQKEKGKIFSYIGNSVRSPFQIQVSDYIEMGIFPYWKPGLFGSFRDYDDHLEECIKRTGVHRFMNRLIHTLSAGEMQLVDLARGLVQKTPVLFLDEAFSHLDLDHLFEICKLLADLKSEGKIIVTVSHDLNFLFGIADEILAFCGTGTGEIRFLSGPLATLDLKATLHQLFCGEAYEMSQDPKTGKPRIFLKTQK